MRGEPILTPDCINYILEMIDEDCTVTLKYIREWIIQRFQVTASVSTISRNIIGYKFSFKRVSLVTERSLSAEIQEQRHAYCLEMREIMHRRRHFFY